MRWECTNDMCHHLTNLHQIVFKSHMTPTIQYENELWRLKEDEREIPKKNRDP